ncbi:MAG: heme exporter protein CcmB [Candidatus Pseudobacter hemicellulosilyticus]|uniref:Heme exporter protein CcmB n=1 Tax=Candidatus Pseudobacter hemicellulosilyticus TaxID=3121375 RepID=A0AAJ5WWL7_9BACT|nr:MAG: heme exporter protein CcmB [Pseudobacter sp.]
MAKYYFRSCKQNTIRSLQHILALVRKDLLLEIRQQYTFYGIVLYVASTVFVLYLAMEQPEARVWNGLFWMIQLFICVNAVAKSFLQESRGRMLYFYTVAGARDFVLSKLLFNAVLMILMSIVSMLLFQLLMGNPLENAGTFLGIVCLGGCSLSLVFSFLAAIAARAQQNAALMAIMGFPLIIPQLLLLMRISSIAFSDVFQAGLGQLVLLLAGLDILVVVLAVILFPFLWKD